MSERAAPARGERILLAVLLAVFALLALDSLRQKSPVVGEAGNLAALGADAEALARAEPHPVLLAARLASVLAGGLLAFLVWRWTRSRFGVQAAALSLALLVLSPGYLAHVRFFVLPVAWPPTPDAIGAARELAARATLPFLLLALGGLGALARSGRWREAVGLGAAALVPAWLTGSAFPAWPLLAILGGACLASPQSLRAPVRMALAILLVWHVAGGLRAHPDYLAHTGEIAALPGAEGLLEPSRKDRGQDLGRAAARLRGLGAQGAVLAYSGEAVPFTGGDFAWQVLPPTRHSEDDERWSVLPAEGELWLAVSTSRDFPGLQRARVRETVGGTIRLYEVAFLPDALIDMAKVYREHGMNAQEEMCLRRAVTERPTASAARVRLVDMLVSRGAEAEARDLIVPARNPQVSEILLVVSYEEGRGEFEAAREFLIRGMRGYPADPDLKDRLARLLVAHDGDVTWALELATQAVSWDPEGPRYRATRGLVLRELGRMDEAVGELETAIALPGGDQPVFQWELALALDDAGRRREAEDRAQAVLGRDDVPPELFLEMGEWFERR